MPSIPIISPSGYAVPSVVAFAGADGTAQTVSTAVPLPVTSATPLSVNIAVTNPTPLAGNATANTLLGPFQPTLARTVILSLSGTWNGTVKVTRSTDNGSTRLPLTIAGAPIAQYTANCCEPIWEENDPAARLYLEVVMTSGSLNYRMA